MDSLEPPLDLPNTHLQLLQLKVFSFFPPKNHGNIPEPSLETKQRLVVLTHLKRDSFVT
jgi:hypothetical protein